MSAQQPPPLRLVVLNVQGLHGPKFPTILRWLADQRADVAILTETHLPSDPADILKATAGGGTIWPGMQTFFVPGTGATEGVAIVLGPRLQNSGPKQFSHPTINSGRVLRLDLELGGALFSIIGVYGHAQGRERRGFYADILPAFVPADGRPTMIGGDFNTVLSEHDIWYPPGSPRPHRSSRFEGGAELGELMELHGFSDIWRQQHPSSISHTHYSASAASGARLDRVLSNRAFAAACPNAAAHIEFAAVVRTDHQAVVLTFHAPVPTIARGTGIDSFPLELLNFPAAVAKLEAFILQAGADLGPVPTPDAWANFKQKLRKKSQDLVRDHRRLRRVALVKAQQAVDAARVAVEGNNDHTRHSLLWAAYRSAADGAALACEGLLAPVKRAAGILEHSFGDKSTYYFFRPAKPPEKPCTITMLKRSGGPPATAPASTDNGLADLRSGPGRDLAMGYAQEFFSSDSPTGLFRPRPISAAAQDAALEELRSKLPLSLQHLAEGPDGDSLLTAEEFEIALSAAGRGSVPGEDGIPYEVYRHFKEALVPLLIGVFNGAFRRSLGESGEGGGGAQPPETEPLRALLVGVICLILKQGQPSDALPGYRPITLLNCDVKLLMLIMSNRLQRPMDYVIDIMQSAFLRGRDISDNVRYHQGLTARLRELGLPAWLLHSDLAKAYDTANRGLVLRAMTAVGLRDTGIVQWNRILLAGTRARIRINGFLGNVFEVHDTSLPQGGALSTNQWDFVAEVVLSQLSGLQHRRLLRSFPLPGGGDGPAGGAFADDITIPVLDPGELSTVIRPAFAQLESAGTPAQSGDKTVLRHLTGPVPSDLDPASNSHHVASAYSLLSPEAERGLRHLGVPVSSCLADCVKAAFSRQPAAMAAAGRHWTCLAPNLLGRALVSNQVIASKVVYQSAFHTPSPVMLTSMQRSVNMFVAASERPEEQTPLPNRLYPSASVCLLPRGAGGLGLPDLVSHGLAMRAKPCWKAMGYNAHPWAKLFCNELSHVTGGRNREREARREGTGGGAAAATAAVVILAVGGADSLAAACRGDTDPALQGLPPGHHWLVTRPAAGLTRLGQIATDSYRESAAAFLQLRVGRVVAPDQQDEPSILMELTFHNPTPATPGISFDSVSTPAARSWLRLRDVRRVHRERSHLQPDELRDLQGILAGLPPAWQRAVCLDAHSEAVWVAVHPIGSSPGVFEGPDTMAEEGEGSAGETGETAPVRRRLWLLFPNSGRLEPFNDPTYAPAAGVQPRPALVVLRRKPREAWDRANYTFAELQKALPQEERREMVEPWLVGMWEDMQLDPRVWGLSPRPSAPHGPGVSIEAQVEGVSLLDMEVKTARMHFNHSRARARNIPGYSGLGGVWPALWPSINPAGG